MTCAVHIQLRRFLWAEMVVLPFAPLAVALGERGFAGQIDTLAVPEGHDKGLPRIRTTVKQPFRAGQTGSNHDDCCPFAVVGAPDSNTYIIWLAKKICSKASL